MTTKATRIDRIALTMIASTDQDRSIAFYEGLGFEKRADAPFGDGHRWVEVYPPGGAAGIALLTPGPDDPIGGPTGVILSSHDIDATHAQLRASGVDVDAEVARVGASARIRLGAADLVEPVPAMFWLRDPDRNALLIVGANDDANNDAKEEER